MYGENEVSDAYSLKLMRVAAVRKRARPGISSPATREAVFCGDEQDYPGSRRQLVHD